MDEETDSEEVYVYDNVVEEEAECKSDPKAKAKAKAKGVSKWNDYIAQDDNDNLQLGSGRNFEHQLHYHTLEFETINNDQRVEDDVHPDFL